MNDLARTLLLVGLALASSADCVGQKKRGARQPARGKVIDLGTRIDTSPREERRVGEVKVEYRSYDDSTTASFMLPVLFRKPTDMFDLTVAYEVKGRGLRRPEKVKWILCAREDRPVFRSARKIEIKADGKTFVIGKVSKKREVYADVREEFIYGDLDFASFEQIAGSENVELRVGPFAMGFVELHKSALRDMIRALDSR